jgi:tetratricopeptide (TPR) repeat protein
MSVKNRGGKNRAEPDLARLSAAAAVSAERLLQLVGEMRAHGTLTPAARRHAARELTEMARPEAALELLEGLTDRPAQRLRALAHDRRNARDDADIALEILVELRANGALDAETAGLLAGRYKSRAREFNDPLQLMKALDLYREAWLSTGDPYPGINAAALALELEGPAESRTLAADVMGALDALSPSAVDHWTYATRGEAHLLLGDLEQAKKWYRRAAAADPTAVQDIAVMRAQARRNLSRLGLPTDALDDAFPIRSVVAFTGHRIDDSQGEASRFPVALEDTVRRTIQARLQALNAGFGFASAASGGDLLFVEEMLERGGSVDLFLPFAPDAFAAMSVGDSERRYRAVLSHPRVRVHTMSADVPAPDDLPRAFAACNAAIRDAAIAFARRLEDTPTLIALWDGAPGPTGGTADAVGAWIRTGCPFALIDLHPVAASSASAALQLPAQSEPWSAIRDVVRLRPGWPASEPVIYHKRFCISIGIDGYTGTAWRPLANAEHDARAVGELLSQAHGFDTRYRLGRGATADGIASAVLDGLRPIVGEHDLVVVYFAGHGHTLRLGGQERGYIVPVDAEELRLSRLISIESLTDWSASLECRHLLFLFDSCFSGMLVRLAGNDRRAPDPQHARLAITSGTAEQTVLDGTAGAHSPFADAVLQALGSGIPGTGEYFTALELYSFIRRFVTARVPLQTPTLAVLRNHEGGEIVFRAPGTAARS